MNIVFFGTRGSIAANILKAVAQEYRIAGVVESFDRLATSTKPANTVKQFLKRTVIGLADKRKKDSIKKVATRLKAPYYPFYGLDSESIKTWLRSLGADIGCIATFHTLLKPEIFNIFPQGVINCHPSLLPKYRGPNPLFWQYYNMEESGGVTIHYIDEGEDTGDILCQEEFPIRPGMPLDETVNSIMRIGSKLMLKALNDISHGWQRPIPQSSVGAGQRARKIKPSEELIDWNTWPIERFWHLLRGFHTTLDVVPPPPVLFSPFFSFQILGYERTRLSQSMIKNVSKDSRGWFITHPEGKIRLKLKPQILAAIVSKIINI